jgi:inorganic pyrophosphatase
MINLSKITVGSNYPNEMNVVIEIPANSDPIKYEIDEESGNLILDRIQATPMFYPCNYGFIPHTKAEDGDALDVMLVCRYNLLPGCIVNARPVGTLIMEDENGMDEKIIAVPSATITSYYDGITEIEHLSPQLIKEIKFFFEQYKALNKDKWAKVEGFKDSSFTKELMLKSLVK